MGIPTGKLSLYTACAGIPPYLTLPIMLDVGTDNQERLNDPLYLGLRHRRIRGREYQDFIDRFVDAVMRVYPDAVLQWEDFLKANAITQLARFRDRLCTFNDDIQGTAAVVAAGVYAALRMTGQAMRDQRVVLGGAGASAQGIANLFVSALRDAGLSSDGGADADLHGGQPGTGDAGAARSWRTSRRPTPGRSTRWRRTTCRDPAHITLEETIRNFGPTILIGTSGAAGPVHGGRGPRDGRHQRPADRVSAVEPDEQERVHGRARRFGGPTAARSWRPAARSTRSSIAAGRTASGRGTTRSSFRASDWACGRDACDASPTPCSSMPPGRWRSLVSQADLDAGRGLPASSRAFATARMPWPAPSSAAPSTKATRRRRC